MLDLLIRSGYTLTESDLDIHHFELQELPTALDLELESGAVIDENVEDVPPQNESSEWPKMKTTVPSLQHICSCSVRHILSDLVKKQEKQYKRQDNRTQYIERQCAKGYRKGQHKVRQKQVKHDRVKPDKFKQDMAKQDMAKQDMVKQDMVKQVMLNHKRVKHERFIKDRERNIEIETFPIETPESLMSALSLPILLGKKEAALVGQLEHSFGLPKLLGVQLLQSKAHEWKCNGGCGRHVYSTHQRLQLRCDYSQSSAIRTGPHHQPPQLQYATLCLRFCCSCWQNYSCRYETYLRSESEAHQHDEQAPPTQVTTN